MTRNTTNIRVIFVGFVDRLISSWANTIVILIICTWVADPSRYNAIDRDKSKKP
jgi:hypothetical protein